MPPIVVGLIQTSFEQKKISWNDFKRKNQKKIDRKKEREKERGKEKKERNKQSNNNIM